MRFFALVPVLLSAAALVISFLCLFAGHREGFMEDFNLFTLNTSRIGATLADNALNGDSSILPAQIQSIIDSLPQEVQSTIQTIASKAADSYAADLGLEDFYSSHIMNYCYGDYTPNPIPNATVRAEDIRKQVDGCSDIKANFWFDPEQVIQDSLDRANVTQLNATQLLDQIGWPDDITRALDALRIAYHAMFACYVITIVLSFLMFVTSFIYFFTNGSRITACCAIIISIITFLASGAASGVATAINTVGADAINDYGAQIGVQANQGRPFLALTWGGTAAVFIGLIYWFVDCCCGKSRKAKKYDTYEKP